MIANCGQGEGSLVILNLRRPVKSCGGACFQISSFNAAAFRYKTEYFFDIDFYLIFLSHGSGQIYTDIFF